ncbi:MAG: 3-oxoacyl-[acyl-carrier-protein] reductase [Chitinivibrionales bacterium]|nr:3-oxoacyl-[acyl-carrier-protein] reductase [Chitinivibrionales bacterium]MBD3395328.1 3-oxoacyl-[acyl-carrier-protein] reductase [Chitinivibrionales bacterium]
MDLAGKASLVTGGGRGIGREIALKLAEAGADVAICDIEPESAQQTAADIEKHGRKSLALKADVSNAGDVSTMFSSFLDAFGKMDVLVNNAGITRDGLIMRMKDADWDSVLAINLKSAFLCCREAARPMMKARGGKIINIASVVGLMGNAGQANYAASKAGLIGLTKTLARELATRAINVNAVAPGFIQTAMTDKLSPQAKESLSARIPMQKLGLPDDVANAVLFLASSLSDYVTGQVLAVDGGLVM